MNFLVFVAALALLTCGALASRPSRKASALRTVARVIGAVLLLLLACFSGFGFLASYEYSAAAERLPWQVGYGLLGIVAIVAAVCVLLRACRRTAR